MIEMKNIETYEWIRSGRGSVAIQVKEDGQVIIRTPYSVSQEQVEQFLTEKAGWIKKQQEKFRQKNRRVITDEIRENGIRLAKRIIPEKVNYYAVIMGVSYGRISIREQKTMWGSCSNDGNLSFNWKIVLMPEDVLDYVIVHELAHRLEMNHSKAFWAIVERVLPDYRERKALLSHE